MKLTKESRQRATAAMFKCACGNVARLGHHECGRCESQANEALNLEIQLDACVDVDDLKEFILIYLINKE